MSMQAHQMVQAVRKTGGSNTWAVLGHVGLQVLRKAQQ
jgi:hypothetical protein